MATKRGITIERQVLLFELDRRCTFADCNERVSVSLTKPEAQDYDGFECNFCERWNADSLTQKDVPDWWDEIVANRSAN
jgi:hypothetical protein